MTGVFVTFVLPLPVGFHQAEPLLAEDALFTMSPADYVLNGDTRHPQRFGNKYLISERKLVFYYCF